MPSKHIPNEIWKRVTLITNKLNEKSLIDIEAREVLDDAIERGIKNIEEEVEGLEKKKKVVKK